MRGEALAQLRGDDIEEGRRRCAGVAAAAAAVARACAVKAEKKLREGRGANIKGRPPSERAVLPKSGCEASVAGCICAHGRCTGGVFKSARL